MRTGVRRAIGSVVLLSMLVLTAGSLTSYIDAGSGSYIIQLIVGAFAGAIMAVGVFWRRIRAAVSRRFSRKG